MKIVSRSQPKIPEYIEIFHYSDIVSYACPTKYPFEDGYTFIKLDKSFFILFDKQPLQPDALSSRRDFFLIGDEENPNKFVDNNVLLFRLINSSASYKVFEKILERYPQLKDGLTSRMVSPRDYYAHLYDTLHALWFNLFSVINPLRDVDQEDFQKEHIIIDTESLIRDSGLVLSSYPLQQAIIWGTQTFLEFAMCNCLVHVGDAGDLTNNPQITYGRELTRLLTEGQVHPISNHEPLNMMREMCEIRQELSQSSLSRIASRILRENFAPAFLNTNFLHESLSQPLIQHLPPMPGRSEHPNLIETEFLPDLEVTISQPGGRHKSPEKLTFSIAKATLDEDDYLTLTASDNTEVTTPLGSIIAAKYLDQTLIRAGDTPKSRQEKARYLFTFGSTAARETRTERSLFLSLISEQKELAAFRILAKRGISPRDEKTLSFLHSYKAIDELLQWYIDNYAQGADFANFAAPLLQVGQYDLAKKILTSPDTSYYLNKDDFIDKHLLHLRNCLFSTRSNRTMESLSIPHTIGNLEEPNSPQNQTTLLLSNSDTKPFAADISGFSKFCYQDPAFSQRYLDRLAIHHPKKFRYDLNQCIRYILNHNIVQSDLVNIVQKFFIENKLFLSHKQIMKLDNKLLEISQQTPPSGFSGLSSSSFFSSQNNVLLNLDVRKKDLLDQLEALKEKLQRPYERYHGNVRTVSEKPAIQNPILIACIKDLYVNTEKLFKETNEASAKSCDYRPLFQRKKGLNLQGYSAKIDDITERLKTHAAQCHVLLDQLTPPRSPSPQTVTEIAAFHPSCVKQDKPQACSEKRKQQNHSNKPNSRNEKRTQQHILFEQGKLHSRCKQAALAVITAIHQEYQVLSHHHHKLITMARLLNAFASLYHVHELDTRKASANPFNLGRNINILRNKLAHNFFYYDMSKVNQLLSILDDFFTAVIPKEEPHEETPSYSSIDPFASLIDLHDKASELALVFSYSRQEDAAPFITQILQSASSRLDKLTTREDAQTRLHEHILIAVCYNELRLLSSASNSILDLGRTHGSRLQIFRNLYMHETFTKSDLQGILNSLHVKQDLSALQTNICSSQEINGDVCESIEKLKGMAHANAREESHSIQSRSRGI